MDGTKAKDFWISVILCIGNWFGDGSTGISQRELQLDSENKYLCTT